MGNTICDTSCNNVKISDATVVENNAFVNYNKSTNNPLNRVEDCDTPLTKHFYENVILDEIALQSIKKKLIDGCDPNIPCICSDGKQLLSPLYLLCRNHRNEIAYDVAKLLISSGAKVEPEYMSLKNYSALGILIKNNNTSTCYKMVELLLQNGADPNLYRVGRTCIDTCVQFHKGPDRKKIIDLLLKYS
jgi:hypothetical protein